MLRESYMASMALAWRYAATSPSRLARLRTRAEERALDHVRLSGELIEVGVRPGFGPGSTAELEKLCPA